MLTMSSSEPVTRNSKRILLGQISGVHGIKGHVLVRTYSAEPEGVSAYGPLENESGDKTYTLDIVRVTAKGVVAAIAGLTDRTSAERLRGTKLYVERAKLPTPAEGEYYHTDLVGLRAVDQAGNDIGTIIAVQNFGASDLLEIKRVGQTDTELVPLLNEFVPVIDLNQGIAVVVLPTLSEDRDNLLTPAPQAEGDGDGDDRGLK
jgi:16S rRNA processing protein RimM